MCGGGGGGATGGGEGGGDRVHEHVVAGQLFCGQLSSHHLSLSASKSEPGPVVVPLQIPNVQPGSATHVDSCSIVQSESLALHVLQTWGVHPSGTAGGGGGRGGGGESGGDGGGGTAEATVLTKQRQPP